MTSATSPNPAAQDDQKNKNIDQRSNGITSNETSVSSGQEGASLMHPPASKTVVGRALGSDLHSDAHFHKSLQAPKGGVGTALTDTPISTAPPSPQM